MNTQTQPPVAVASSEELERTYWRAEVVAFANAMERELRENDHKGGWSEDAPHELLRRLIEETAEVVRVLQPEKGSADFYAAAAMLDSAAGLLRRWGPDLRTTGEPEAVLGECADVGNFALMLADRLGAL
jgi:NTP pyrophosphatase (non-canonical NTP hydrolase)